MTAFGIQFHALPGEMLPFVRACVQDFHLHVIGIEFPPYRASEVDVRDLDNIISDASRFCDVALTLNSPKLPSGVQDAMEVNPDALVLQIGKKTEAGLEESYLTCKTDNENALTVWKQIAKRLKKITKAGVTVVNPKTGAVGFERTFRYTAGAKECERHGVPILSTSKALLHKLGAFPNDDNS